MKKIIRVLWAVTVLGGAVGTKAAPSASNASTRGKPRRLSMPIMQTKTLQALDRWLALERTARPPLEKEAFASTPMTRAEWAVAAQRLWDDYVEAEKPKLAEEWKNKAVQIGDRVMKFEYRMGDTKPATGWDLHLAFHGGGGAPPAVNDSQWMNHIRLYDAYKPRNALYVAPRAPTDTWNLWHEAHIDGLLARIIEGAVLVMGANPDRVYISGYSAGGDGVYQLAPRMADRLAAASAMAGHPNETQPLGLRNIGFTLHMGENDAAYDRNKVASEWKQKLAALHAADPKGYRHEVTLHKGKGHWMDLEDAVAMPWMAECTRVTLPEKVVWKQDDVTYARFYWLAVPEKEQKPGAEIVAERKGQVVQLSGVSGLGKVTILLNDAMLDLDKKVVIQWKGKTLFNGAAPRTLAALSRSLDQRKDPKLFFAAEVTVDLAE